VAQLDLAQIGQLFFERPDLARFPCLKLAYDALHAGGSAAAILNAANEVAVEAFLNQEIGFRMIDQVIARVMDRLPHGPVTDIDALIEQDKIARSVAKSCLTL
jgi:1-deoxy-D-xylulose-5-phosphate reductoisomerase